MLSEKELAEMRRHYEIDPMAYAAELTLLDEVDRLKRQVEALTGHSYAMPIIIDDPEPTHSTVTMTRGQYGRMNPDGSWSVQDY